MQYLLKRPADVEGLLRALEKSAASFDWAGVTSNCNLSGIPESWKYPVSRMLRSHFDVLRIIKS